MAGLPKSWVLAFLLGVLLAVIAPHSTMAGRRSRPHQQRPVAVDSHPQDQQHRGQLNEHFKLGGSMRRLQLQKWTRRPTPSPTPCTCVECGTWDGASRRVDTD